jgi:hypothetical protein
VASYIKDTTQIDGVTKEGMEEDICMKWEEGNGDCKNPYTEKPYNLYFSPNVSGVIKSRRMMCQGYTARSGEK